MVEQQALNQIWLEARTHYVWQDRPVSDQLLQQIYDVCKWAPTSANSNPARFVFIKTPEAKDRLKRHLMPQNVEKSMQAPVNVIVAFDTQFFEFLPELFPHDLNAKNWFNGEDLKGYPTAFRNSSLQGAYFILAARALGLDCGPMSGFNAASLDQDFFPDGRWRCNFLINLGYGVAEKVKPRAARLGFDRSCQIL